MELDIVGLVKADLEERGWVGLRKYGKRLSRNRPLANGLTALENAYEEALDLALYLKKALCDATDDLGDTCSDCGCRYSGEPCVVCGGCPRCTESCPTRCCYE